MEEVVKEYSNGEITVVWKPVFCTHVRFCWKELPEVFNPRNRPWVNMQGATTERIIQQVERCPTQALTYYTNDNKEKPMEENKNHDHCVTAEIVKNGPVVISGCVHVKQDGNREDIKEEGVAFCRCAKSKIQPYCDGSHVNHPFE